MRIYVDVSIVATSHADFHLTFVPIYCPSTVFHMGVTLYEDDPIVHVAHMVY